MSSHTLSIYRYLLFIFLMSGSFIHSEEQENAVNQNMPAAIEKIFLTAEELENHPNLDMRSLAELDKGHPKTLLFLDHFPVDEKLTYSIKRLVQPDQSFKTQGKFFIDKDGLITGGGAKKTAFFCISGRGFLPGERITCNFKTQDRQFEKEISFIPTPIIGKNKAETAFVEAELKILVPAFYQFTFSGFKENETIRSTSISGEEKLKYLINVTKNSLVVNTPDVIGEKGGVAKSIFTRKNGDLIQINLPWGVEWDGYLNGDKVYQPN